MAAVSRMYYFRRPSASCRANQPDQPKRWIADDGGAEGSGGVGAANRNRCCQQDWGALAVNNNTHFNYPRVQIITLASHQRPPAIFSHRVDAQEGGLMSYGSLDDPNRQVGL
jgi:hypothetical protein